MKNIIQREIKSYIEDLVAQDIINVWDMSQTDESYLTGLLMQSQEVIEIALTDDNDKQDIIFNMTAKFCKSNDIDDALEIANYLKSLALELYPQKIQDLLDNESYDKPEVVNDRRKYQQECDFEANRSRI